MKVFPSNHSGQNPKVDSHAQAMAWSKKHVAANNTRATGSQAGTSKTSIPMKSMKPSPFPKQGM